MLSFAMIWTHTDRPSGRLANACASRVDAAPKQYGPELEH